MIEEDNVGAVVADDEDAVDECEEDVVAKDDDEGGVFAIFSVDDSGCPSVVWVEFEFVRFPPDSVKFVEVFISGV